MKQKLLLIPLLFVLSVVAAQAAQIDVYLLKSSVDGKTKAYDTSWQIVKCFAWYGNTTYTDSYPGDQMSTVYVGGVEYYKKSISIDGNVPENGISVIFNNGKDGGGSNQTVDITGVKTTSYYGIGSQVTEEGANKEKYNVSSEFITVYLLKSESYDPTTYIWAWLDDKTNLTGGKWPGQEMTETETIGGKEYYKKTFCDNPINILFNNNNNDQTEDIRVTATTYYKLNRKDDHDGVTSLTNPVIEADFAKVQISADAGAKIYYTTSGIEPTTSSTVYSGPFTVESPTTVKAIAVKDDLQTKTVTQTISYDTYTVTPGELTFAKIEDVPQALTTLEIMPDGAKHKGEAIYPIYYTKANQLNVTITLTNNDENDGWAYTSAKATYRGHEFNADNNKTITINGISPNDFDSKNNKLTIPVSVTYTNAELAPVTVTQNVSLLFDPGFAKPAMTLSNGDIYLFKNYDVTRTDWYDVDAIIKYGNEMAVDKVWYMDYKLEKEMPATNYSYNPDNKASISGAPVHNGWDLPNGWVKPDYIEYDGKSPWNEKNDWSSEMVTDKVAYIHLQDVARVPNGTEIKNAKDYMVDVIYATFTAIYPFMVVPNAAAPGMRNANAESPAMVIELQKSATTIDMYELDPLKATTTGVADIAVDTQGGVAEYYNLQGVRVDADNLVPGVYIRREAGNTTKVYVK